MEHKLAITIAGAVSLGSFEAGVLFEVMDALGQHNLANSVDPVYIDVLTGASAGGMTAAIAAFNMLYAADALAAPYDNPFYNAWVAGVDINGLLPLASGEPPDHSVLSSDYVYGIARTFLLERYRQGPIPPARPHPALSPKGNVSLGLALSNLNGVDFARSLLSGGTFNYTLYQDQKLFSIDAASDNESLWSDVKDAACACGAFPFAFRPVSLNRKDSEYDSPYKLPWKSTPQAFTYTDGGVFQNQPLGMAKSLVNKIDNHRDSDLRSYLFVSPQAVPSTVGALTVGAATFLELAHGLIDAIYSQAGFQDWIEAESVNDSIALLNTRAQQLSKCILQNQVDSAILQHSADALLPQFGLTPSELDSARAQLRSQFNALYASVSLAKGAASADAWIDSLLLLELAADIHDKDEMYIYSVTADKMDLAGAGFFSFFGFLDRSFRDHDYDLGRKKTQDFLLDINRISGGKLPKLEYVPKPIRPIQATPAGGFTPTMIAENNRKRLFEALSHSADTFLQEIGIPWIVRKGVEVFYVNGKLKEILGLR